MKIKRRGEVVIELDSDEAEEFRRFLYSASTSPEFYYYEPIVNDMYQKLADI